MCDHNTTGSEIRENIFSVKPCLFISYQRPDKVIVNDIIRRLQRNGFELWWDKQIEAGVSWERSIENALRASRSFLGFISNGISESEWSLYELNEAIQHKKNDPNYTLVLVFLEKVPLSSFPEKIREEIKQSQYISFWEYGGITEDFLRNLLSANWDRSVIKEEFHERIRSIAGDGRLGTLSEFFKDVDVQPRSYHRLSHNTNKSKADGGHPAFYRLTPNDLTSRETVYPVILDNQWIPPEFYDENAPKYELIDEQLHKDFKEKGLSSENNGRLKAEIENMQRREFIRALLHNWQLVINRASIFNTTALRKWYSSDSPDYEAFKQLIGDDSIIVYLLDEDHPTDTPRFDYDKENYNAWKDLCFACPEGHEVSCVRFDWEKESNNSEKARLLSGRV